MTIARDSLPHRKIQDAFFSFELFLFQYLFTPGVAYICGRVFPVGDGGVNQAIEWSVWCSLIEIGEQWCWVKNGQKMVEIRIISNIRMLFQQPRERIIQNN